MARVQSLKLSKHRRPHHERSLPTLHGHRAFFRSGDRLGAGAPHCDATVFGTATEKPLPKAAVSSMRYFPNLRVGNTKFGVWIHSYERGGGFKDRAAKIHRALSEIYVFVRTLRLSLRPSSEELTRPELTTDSTNPESTWSTKRHGSTGSSHRRPSFSASCVSIVRRPTYEVRYK